MKNKWMAMMVVTALAASLVGCGGSSEQAEIQNELGISESEYNELASEIAEGISGDEKETSTEAESTEAESAEVKLLDWSGYEPTEEIQNASLEDGKIQIADTVYEMYIPLSEFLEKVDSSEVDYYCEAAYHTAYEPDSLVLSGGRYQLSFYINCENASERYADYPGTNSYIFTVSALNPTEDTITAKECYVVGVTLNYEAFGCGEYDAAYQVVLPGGVYYGAGFDITGANIATYSEGKQIFEAEAEKNENGDIYVAYCSEATDSDGNIKVSLAIYLKPVECPEIGVIFGSSSLGKDYGGNCESTYEVLYDPSTGQIASPLKRSISDVSVGFIIE